ncbi:uncharacterized protein MELLADRAFT_64924 [Melampsora larici-populina 98AG31]|uniref:Uncharacterized protein n=1 Tax=Melampsora larici-populina (strain 98AG31 / pathotype 3-4-7) TaxID=747676 RepID=F4RTA5_MELLP|nr:uncharacterized protein MELLADRAFT_64924 [Melampsora larici-populina 98AG31]EGG04227.1 hypothetical protein MELLADRAFT_64924 [Melampsora larici-populina 98AG31]
MTTTSRYLKHKADRSTLSFRRKGLIILLALIFFFGTCSAKRGSHRGGNNRPGNTNTGSKKTAKNDKPTSGDKNVSSQVAALTAEVKAMDGFVAKLTSGKDAKSLKAAAEGGIRSEHKQNSLRASLAKVGNVPGDLKTINGLIDQIIQTPAGASRLAKDITEIRGRAKPSKDLLFIHISLSSTRIIDAATKNAGSGTNQSGNKPKPHH